MAGAGTNAAKGAVTGAAVGTAIPVVGNLVGGVVGGVIGLVGGLFGSKKHYNLYYWNPEQSAWTYVMEGHSKACKKAAAGYIQQGFVTQIVRNKKGSAIAPTLPPAGYETTSGLPDGKTSWIVAGIVVVVVLGVVLARKRAKS